MKERYEMFAAYNAWANERLFDAVSQLSDASYREDRGAFFGSIHGTLNHLLVADRIWVHRFIGVGDAPQRLDQILYREFPALREARRAEDRRILHYVDSLDAESLSGEIRYRALSNPASVTQKLSTALDHFFNHQTHHRGQVHGLLTSIVGQGDAPSLDLVLLQRETGLANIS